MQIRAIHNKRQRILLTLIVGALFLFMPLVTFAGIGDKIGGFIFDITTGLGATVLWLFGGLFDYVVITLVVEMGQHIGPTSSIGGVIVHLWELVRDVFNLLFIFGIIYIGFRVILFSEDSNVHKTLGWLIVAALMINFSLFITQAIVDVSNAISYQLYTSMITENLEEVEHANAAGEVADRTRTIAATIVYNMKLTTYMSDEGLRLVEGKDTALTNDAFFGFVMMFIMLIAAFVFAAGAFMFFARFIALIIFMIVSPVMFVGMIFPYFGPYQRMWWNAFLRYAFVAPAFLFMIYISLNIITKINLRPGVNDNFAAAFAADSWIEGKFMVFLYFFIVAGFLIASLYIANKMGVYGAGASMKMLQDAGNSLQSRAKRVAGGATFGLGGRVLRNTAGYAAQNYADSEDAKKWASRSAVGKAVHRGAIGLGSASFDARQIGGAGKQFGLGEGVKGGYKGAQDAIEKKEKAYAKTLEVSDSDPIITQMNDDIKEKEEKLKEQRDLRALAKAGKIEGKTEAQQKEILKGAEAEIYRIEEELKEDRKKVSNEKYRNILGVAGAPETHKAAKNNLKEREEQMKTFRQTRKEVIKLMRETSRDDAAYGQLQEELEVLNIGIKEQKKLVAQARQEVRVADGNLGYAETLKSSNFFTSTARGRIMAQDHNAGSEIEKAYKKKIKETKEDRHFNSLQDAVKSSAKS